MEETILTEVVANALDSGTTAIELRADPPTTTLTVIDNGSGMSRRELARYHDIATSGKRRGAGIGFAGVGIKLGLLVSDDVTTETRRGQTHVATSWRLASRQKAPWRWISTPDLVPVRGTAVALHLTNALSPLLDPGFARRGVPPRGGGGDGTCTSRRVASRGTYIHLQLSGPMGRGGRWPAAELTAGVWPFWRCTSRRRDAVPFEAFGFDGEPGWFRLSVGSVPERAIAELLARLRDALKQL